MNNFHYPELEKFYNVPDGNRTAFITMDADWAPDFVLKYTFEWFFRNNIAFTVFMTHESEYVKSVTGNPLMEIGIHPDFSKCYYADDRRDNVEDLMDVYPSAVGSRSHRNICGRLVYDSLFDANIRYDVSKILWGATGCQVTPLYNGMVEAPYVWEDGVRLEIGNRPFIDPMAMMFDRPGLSIFNIHPMLFYLNCTNDGQLKDLTKDISNLTTATKEDLSPYVFRIHQQICGIGDLFRMNIINIIDGRSVTFHKLSEVMLPAHRMEAERR